MQHTCTCRYHKFLSSCTCIQCVQSCTCVYSASSMEEYQGIVLSSLYSCSVFLEIFRGQTNILRNGGGGGGRLQLKCIKLKPAKAQGGGGGKTIFRGGGGMPPSNPLKNPARSKLHVQCTCTYE